MKRACRWFSVILCFAFGRTAHAEQKPEELFKAVVKIKAMIPKDARTAHTLGTEREGSGVVIDSKGHILTIGYLVMEAEAIEVYEREGSPVRATLVGYDHGTGFGLLRVSKPLNVEPVKFGESSKLTPGEPVLVASHGGSDSVQGSAVIARKEFAGYWEYLLDDAIFTAPPIANFGGAALIGRDGRLLGIGSLFTQMAIPGLGSIPCNLFVPIDLLLPILDDLIARGRPGKPSRPWLGINAEEAHSRIFVTQVTSGGPAERDGLKPDDLILTVKDVPIRGLPDFYRRVWALGDPGVDVPLTILRGTEILTITIRSSDRYQFLNLRPQKVL